MSKYEWNFSEYYGDISKCYTELKTIDGRLKEYDSYKEHFLDSAQNLYNGIQLDFDITQKLDNLKFYIDRKYDIDITNSEVKKIKNEIAILENKKMMKTEFFYHELSKLNLNDLSDYIKENPKLNKLRLYLERIIKNNYHMVDLKDKELENELTYFSNLFVTNANLLRNRQIDFGIIEFDGKNIEVSNNNYKKYMSNSCRELRKKYFEKFYKKYAEFSELFGINLKENIRINTKLAILKKYNNPIEYFLSQEEIDCRIYDNLIISTNENLSILHKYYKLRKEILNYDELHIYDLYIPLISEYNKIYPFEEAKKIVISSLNILGENYTKIIEEAFDKNWIDCFPKKGKVSGAYGGGVYGQHPYVLINYSESIWDVKTLIHELGHAANAYLSFHNQEYPYVYYSTFVEEIPSIVNEFILYDYLKNNSKSAKEKLFYASMEIEIFVEKYFRATMQAEYEKQIYDLVLNNQFIDYNILNELYYNLQKKYYGKDVFVDKEISTEWERILQYFEYPLYTYQYATSVCSAFYISQRLINGDSIYIDKYLKFLTLGNSVSPMESLKMIDFDLNDKQMFAQIINEFEKMLNEFVQNIKSAF